MGNAPRKPSEPGALSPQQRAAVVALAAGETQERAAELAGVNRSTVQDWMRKPAFVAALDAEVDAALADARRTLRRSVSLAVNTLLDVAADPDAPSAARVQAAKEVLNRTGLVEVTEQRVAASVEVDPGDKAAAAFRALLSLSPEERAALRKRDP